MNQKTRAAMLSAVIFALPVVTWAQVGIPCGVDLNADNVIKNIPGVIKEECDFDSIIQLVNNIIKFLIFSVAVPLAAIGFMVMGAKMIIYSNKESAKTEAKEGIWLIIKGFLIMLAAYVVIKTILFAFLNDKDTELISLMQFMFQ